MQTIAGIQRLDELTEAISNDRRHGASELALRALKLLARARPVRNAPAGGYRRDVRRLARRIGHARPAMAPVEAVTAKFLKRFDATVAPAKSAGEIHRVVRLVAAELERELADLTPSAARHFATRFARIRRPLVISYSSQVIAAITAMPHRSQRVTVCESRPTQEGRRTARLLIAVAKSVTLITEAQIGAAALDCDCALLGCDAVYADGSIANKSGSYLVALACRERSHPVIVVGDRFKIGAAGGDGETHPSKEVWKNPPCGIRVSNQYFERVPRTLIDYLVLDCGVYRPRELKSVWRKEQKTRV